ncbi:hypothetical protein GCM10007100_10330 [Roseibacillus persicicus]|uniref:BIG2 domain-containing protein n=2 Tax=Roseibacillus persicicus TaxID=454148 RepID=A0A918TKX7_9BACT|nr:hypothetical protein GCM10007100_10330 [Roseibacillus persicicus]
MKMMRRILTGVVALSGVVFGQGEERQPNVVLILIDDLSHYGVSAYGAEKLGSLQGHYEDVAFETPRMDSLAVDGLRCDFAYAYPLCEPTRIALMSGKNNNRNYHKPKSQHASDITFGDLFQREGYETCLVGKWKQTRGTKEIPGKDYIYEFGWDEFCCFDVTTEGHRMLHPKIVQNGKPLKTDGVDPETGRRFYGPDVFNRYALDFMKRKKEKPFFLYYSMVLVHDEHTPTPDTKPESVYDDWDHLKQTSPKAMRGNDPKYFPDMVAYTDKMVGQVLDQLKALELEDETLVVLMGDNGTKEIHSHILPDGTVFKGNKGANKEGGLHVPLLVRSPGEIVPGQTYEGLVDVTDILPTLCEAADIPLPKNFVLDGRSFWKQVTGKSEKGHRDYIYTWYNGNHDSSDLSQKIEYVFTKEFKRYAPSSLYPEGRFFDLRTDLFEEVGEEVKKVPKRWNKWRRSGLKVDELTAEQKKAYEQLGGILEAEAYVAMTGLSVENVGKDLAKGESVQLAWTVAPANATRQGVVWESSDPAVASVDKFGVVTAHQEGGVTITAYSWDDAIPLADPTLPEMRRDGIQSAIEIRVR